MILVDLMFRKRKLQLSSLEWTLEVATVEAVQNQAYINTAKVTNMNEEGVREVRDVI